MKKFFGIIILIIFTIILYPIMVAVTVWNKLTITYTEGETTAPIDSQSILIINEE